MAQGTFTRLTYERLGVILTDAPGYKTLGSTFEDLSRVQSVAYGFTNDSRKIKSIGSDSLILFDGKSPLARAPEVNFQIEYLFCEPQNESSCGLYIGQEGSVLKNIIESPTTDDINILVVASNEDSHKDIIRLQQFDFENYNVIGVGNAFLDSYSYSASIGSLPSCSLTFAAGNIVFDTYQDTNKPALPSLKLGTQNDRSSEVLELNETSFSNSLFKTYSSDVSAIKPGDIKVSIEKLNGQKGGADISFFSMVQNISIDLQIPREVIYGMGSNYPFNRKLRLPAEGTVSIDVILNKFEATSAQNLFDEISSYRIEIEHIREGQESVFILIDQAQLESENFDANIQNNSSVSIQMSYPVSKDSGLKIFTAPKV